MNTIFSILLWIYWAICIISCFLMVFIVYLLTALFDRYNRIPNKLVQWLAWVMMKANPGWKITVQGADRRKIAKPTIVIANHRSFLDMPLMYLLPWRMKWVAKNDLFKIPIFGWIIYMTGHLGIDRASARSARKLDKLVEPIRQGIPAMIFPEGTRHTSTELGRFKNGAFRLAKRYGFQILPVAIYGSDKAMPPGSWKIAPKQTFTVSVLEPIPSDRFESKEELRQHAHSMLHREMKRLNI